MQPSVGWPVLAGLLLHIETRADEWTCIKGQSETRARKKYPLLSPSSQSAAAKLQSRHWTDRWCTVGSRAPHLGERTGIDPREGSFRTIHSVWKDRKKEEEKERRKKRKNIKSVHNAPTLQSQTHAMPCLTICSHAASDDVAQEKFVSADVETSWRMRRDLPSESNSERLAIFVEENESWKYTEKMRNNGSVNGWRNERVWGWGRRAPWCFESVDFEKKADWWNFINPPSATHTKIKKKADHCSKKQKWPRSPHFSLSEPDRVAALWMYVSSKLQDFHSLYQTQFLTPGSQTDDVTDLSAMIQYKYLSHYLV